MYLVCTADELVTAVPTADVTINTTHFFLPLFGWGRCTMALPPKTKLSAIQPLKKSDLWGLDGFWVDIWGNWLKKNRPVFYAHSLTATPPPHHSSTPMKINDVTEKLQQIMGLLLIIT